MSFGTIEAASTSGSAASATSGSLSGPKVRGAAVARSAAAHRGCIRELLQAAQGADDLVLGASADLGERLGLFLLLGEDRLVPVALLELLAKLDLQRGQVGLGLGRPGSAPG